MLKTRTSGVDAPTKAKIEVFSSCKFHEMSPAEAFALIEQITQYDAMYEPSFRAEVPCVSVCAVTTVPIEENPLAEENKELKRKML